MVGACGAQGCVADLPFHGQPRAATDSSSDVRPSTRITGITFDTTSLHRYCNDTDIWPTTWADDDFLYTAGGDGRGWDETDTRGLAVVRLDLRYPTADLASSGLELYSKPDVLPKGLISVDGSLFLLEQERGNGFARARIGRSTDFGRHWTYNGDGVTTWDIVDPPFAQGHFINHGKNNEGAPGGFVYVLGVEGTDGQSPFDQVVLARVAPAHVQDVSRWEYFVGTSVAPRWSRRFDRRTPILRREGQIHWGPTINFNPVLGRYLLTFFTNDEARLAVYEGAAPWGPWRLISEQMLISADEKYSLFFVNRPGWISPDGKEWWFVMSGVGEWDSFNVMRARLTLEE